MTSYRYPQVAGGFRWNALQRIKKAIGIEPIGTADLVLDVPITVLTFDRELTRAEKTALDAVMADNPTFPPTTGGTRFIIRDVWNQRSFLEGRLGRSYDLYYQESTPGSGDVDEIVLVFSTTLTTGQRDQVISEFGNLIRVV